MSARRGATTNTIRRLALSYARSKHICLFRISHLCDHSQPEMLMITVLDLIHGLVNVLCQIHLGASH